jgi:hypothetical protein
MKTLKKHLLTAGLFCVVLALPCRSAAASPGQSVHLTFKGLTADASFDNVDPTGCIETSVSITATNGTIKTVNVIGGPQASSSALVSLSQSDFCTLTVLLDAFSTPVPLSLAAGAFQINTKLNSATLNTSADVFDTVSGNTFSVQVSITWAGTGGIPTAFRDMFVMRGPGVRINRSAFAITFDPATASGSVVIPGGTNLTPGPSDSADLESVKSGDLTLCTTTAPCD